MRHPSFRTLEDYCRRLAGSGPASEIANFFHLPAALIVGDQKYLFNTESDLEVVYHRVMEKYRTEGIAKLTWDDSESSLLQIYPYLVLVKTVISRERVDGSVVKRWACSYLIRELSGGWKFDVVTAIPN